MLSHLMLGTNDLEASRRFYDAVLGTLGAQPAVKLEMGGLTRYLWTHNGTHLMVAQPRDGLPATHANGFTLGLQAQSEEQVQAALQAALAHGGVEVEDPIGWRDGGVARYLAYVRDPAGHKLCLGYRPHGFK